MEQVTGVVLVAEVIAILPQIAGCNICQRSLYTTPVPQSGIGDEAICEALTNRGSANVMVCPPALLAVHNPSIVPVPHTQI